MKRWPKKQIIIIRKNIRNNKNPIPDHFNMVLKMIEGLRLKTWKRQTSEIENPYGDEWEVLLAEMPF